MSKILFLDESGDHSLSVIDPQHPVFALCGVIMDETYHATQATQSLDAFKQDIFGKKGIILHTLDFTRNQGEFERMRTHEFRLMFFSRLSTLIQELDFKIVACAIKKQEHLSKYGLNAIDPYVLSLSILIERFIFECGSAGGSVVAESRDRTLDNALELAFLDLKIRGTQYVSATKVTNRIHSFTVRKKSENLAGLQIADVVATPIARHVLGKITYPKYADGGDFFSIIRPKLRCDWEGNYEGMGLAVLPK